MDIDAIIDLLTTDPLSQDLLPKLCARPPRMREHPDADFALSLTHKDTRYALQVARGDWTSPLRTRCTVGGLACHGSGVDDGRVQRAERLWPRAQR
jgi:hypothetical protein